MKAALLLVLPLSLPLLVPGPGERQPGATGEAAVDDPTVFASSVPFGPGEEALYQLKLGAFSVGEARLAVAGVEDVRGHASYRLEMSMKGRYVFARVDDAYWSWMDARTLASRRYIRDVHQVRYKNRREFEIFPEERRWERTDAEDRGETLSELPLDDLAFIYFVRTLPLVVGEEYRFDRYYKDDGNPVVVRVLRRERRTVPAGTFDAVVVQPVIRTSGLFAEGGNAEIYFSDDEHRHVVYLRSQIPRLGVGSITLHLTGVRPGRSFPTPARAAGTAPAGG